MSATTNAIRLDTGSTYTNNVFEINSFRKNLEIHPITKQEALELISKYHYSKGNMPRLTKYYLGVFLNKDLVGVITLGFGTQPKGTQRQLGITDFNYLEIGRMAMTEEMPHNSESQMLSKLTKWVRANTEVDFIYTMADGSMGKVGYCYQAANYIYLGDYYTQVIVDAFGNKHHPKSEAVRPFKLNGGCWPNKDLMDEMGWSQWKVKMYRYIMPVTKRAVRFSKGFERKANPKDQDLFFGKSEKVVGLSTRRYLQKERQYFNQVPQHLIKAAATANDELFEKAA